MPELAHTAFACRRPRMSKPFCPANKLLNTSTRRVACAQMEPAHADTPRMPVFTQSRQDQAVSSIATSRKTAVCVSVRAGIDGVNGNGSQYMKMELNEARMGWST